MSVNKELLATLQKAGAAVFDADAQLKLAVARYGERVHAAVGANPFHLGNDTLFENWKMVARLSKTLTAMEEDLRNVYQMAGALSDVEPAMPALMPTLSAPAASAEAGAPRMADSRLTATDVKIKRKKRVAAAKPGPTTVAPLPGNADRLLKHLRYVLKTKGFAPVNQTALARATGIPMGSMTASLKRLVSAGFLQTNASGQYKLV